VPVDDFQRVVALRTLRATDGLAAATLPSSLAQQLPTITAGNARIAALRNVRCAVKSNSTTSSWA
jgi:hypothetical protein